MLPTLRRRNANRSAATPGEGSPASLSPGASPALEAAHPAEVRRRTPVVAGTAPPGERWSTSNVERRHGHAARPADEGHDAAADEKPGREPLVTPHQLR